MPKKYTRKLKKTKKKYGGMNRPENIDKLKTLYLEFLNDLRGITSKTERDRIISNFIESIPYELRTTHRSEFLRRLEKYKKIDLSTLTIISPNIIEDVDFIMTNGIKRLAVELRFTSKIGALSGRAAAESKAAHSRMLAARSFQENGLSEEVLSTLSGTAPSRAFVKMFTLIDASRRMSERIPEAALRIDVVLASIFQSVELNHAFESPMDPKSNIIIARAIEELNALIASVGIYLTTDMGVGGAASVYSSVVAPVKDSYDTRVCGVKSKRGERSAGNIVSCQYSQYGINGTEVDFLDAKRFMGEHLSLKMSPGDAEGMVEGLEWGGAVKVKSKGRERAHTSPAGVEKSMGHIQHLSEEVAIFDPDTIEDKSVRYLKVVENFCKKIALKVLNAAIISTPTIVNTLDGGTAVHAGGNDGLPVSGFGAAGRLMFQSIVQDTPAGCERFLEEYIEQFTKNTTASNRTTFTENELEIIVMMLGDPVKRSGLIRTVVRFVIQLPQPIRREPKRFAGGSLLNSSVNLDLLLLQYYLYIGFSFNMLINLSNLFVINTTNNHLLKGGAMHTFTGKAKLALPLTENNMAGDKRPFNEKAGTVEDSRRAEELFFGGLYKRIRPELAQSSSGRITTPQQVAQYLKGTFTEKDFQLVLRSCTFLLNSNLLLNAAFSHVNYRESNPKSQLRLLYSEFLYKCVLRLFMHEYPDSFPGDDLFINYYIRSEFPRQLLIRTLHTALFHQLHFMALMGVTSNIEQFGNFNGLRDDINSIIRMGIDEFISSPLEIPTINWALFQERPLIQDIPVTSDNVLESKKLLKVCLACYHTRDIVIDCQLTIQQLKRLGHKNTKQLNSELVAIKGALESKSSGESDPLAFVITSTLVSSTPPVTAADLLDFTFPP